jgi:hypothetical protein
MNGRTARPYLLAREGMAPTTRMLLRIYREEGL